MRTKNYFLLISVLSLVFGSIAFTSCSDDDDKDSKTSSIEGYWKLTKSTNSYSPGETTFGDDEGFIIWFDETKKTETHYEYDYEGQLLNAGAVEYIKEGKTITYSVKDEETGLIITLHSTIKKLTDNTLVMYSDYSEETTYFKRINKPMLENVSVNKAQLLGKWQMIETWEPGDGSAEEIDPSEIRKIWIFNDGEMSQESTSLVWGPATMELFKWNFDNNIITLFDYFDPNKHEADYEILRYDGTYLKIREWTEDLDYKVMKFKSLAKG